MLYSMPHNCFPDLNYFSAPSCPVYPLIEPSFIFLQNDCYYQPRTVKIKVLSKEDFIVSSPNHFEIIPAEKVEEGDNEETEHTIQKNKDMFCITKDQSSSATSAITDQSITEFNTNQKLRKIHSTYHLKRKISTKLQNDIKVIINALIEKNNLKNSMKLPFVSPNTKSFREDVKIQSLKQFSLLTIGEYICEDVSAGRSLNKMNKSLIDKVTQIHEISPCENIKKLFQLLNHTLVRDYYDEFILSQRFQKCYQKDIKKYESKLNQLNFKDEKKERYRMIFAEKYSGIAKSYFTCE